MLEKKKAKEKYEERTREARGIIIIKQKARQPAQTTKHTQ